MGWSHELCTPDERLLWARLSVFAGSFEAEAAAYVCGDARVPNVPAALARLADKSVVCSVGDRFHMLDTVRDYGREWLRELGEEEHMMLRHRDHYVALARRAEADWCGPNQETWADWARGEIAQPAAGPRPEHRQPARPRPGGPPVVRLVLPGARPRGPLLP